MPESDDEVWGNGPSEKVSDIHQTQSVTHESVLPENQVESQSDGDIDMLLEASEDVRQTNELTDVQGVVSEEQGEENVPKPQLSFSSSGCPPVINSVVPESTRTTKSRKNALAKLQDGLSKNENVESKLRRMR